MLRGGGAAPEGGVRGRGCESCPVTGMADAQDKQAMFRNMFHKRPVDDTGLPPPKAAAAAASAPALDKTEEEKMEEDLFGDMDEHAPAKEVDPEDARKAAQLSTSRKSLVKDQEALPHGWVQRTSKKKASGKVYYVNLITKKYQRERPISDEVEAQVEQPAAKKQKVKPKVTNVAEALVRLTAAMRKEEKFGKATSMVVQLMNNNLASENSDAFAKLIEAVLLKRDWIHSHKLQPHYLKLLEVTVAKRDLFAPARQEQIDVWEFDVLKHAQLITDDSFAFATAASSVLYDMERRLRLFASASASPRPTMADGVAVAQAAKRDYEIRVLWEIAIMAMLHTACERHKFAWAKGPVMQLISKAYDLRYTLRPENKAKVERFQRLCSAANSAR